jgi:hypothetical protein
MPFLGTFSLLAYNCIYQKVDAVFFVFNLHYSCG